jgi:hypothetical protein
MPGETHRVVLSSWSRPVVVATVLAYRASMGEQPRGWGAGAVHRRVSLELQWVN